MNAEELRALQAPLKQQYRADPRSALVTSRVEVALDPVLLTARLDSGAPRFAGLHRATGGTGDAACSADLLLEALAACAGVTLLAVATSSGIELAGGRVIAEGAWDARGTLAVDKTVPVGMRDIAITFDLETSADRSELDRLLRATERYCVILATLQQASRVTVSLKSAL